MGRAGGWPGGLVATAAGVGARLARGEVFGSHAGRVLQKTGRRAVSRARASGGEPEQLWRQDSTQRAAGLAAVGQGPRGAGWPRQVPGSGGPSPAPQARDEVSTLGPARLRHLAPGQAELAPHPPPQKPERGGPPHTSCLLPQWDLGRGTTRRISGKGGARLGSRDGQTVTESSRHGPREGGGPRPLCPIALGREGP